MATETLTNSGDAAWVLISACLVLLMTPALALFYGGMSHQKSVLNMMMMSFGAMGVVTVVYVLWGWSMSYGDQDIGGIIANPFQDFGLKNSITDAAGNYIMGETYPRIIDVGFQLTFAVISTALISGAIVDRAKFSTWLIFTGTWSTLVYFPLAHMVWGGGFLSESTDSLSALLFGHNEEGALIAPIDFAGGTVVHISAGTAALILAIVVGKRRGFMKTPSRPHNLPFVMLGAALLWFGWLGFNAGSAVAADGTAGLAWVNTTAATAAGMLGWIFAERLRDGHATSLGAASGVVAGLVTITPACGDVNPWAALLMGFIGGVLGSYGVSLKYRFKFDDSLDVVGVHLVGAFWGTIAIGLFANDSRGILTGGGADGVKLFVVQLLIGLCAIIISAVITFAIAMALKATVGWRVDDETEYNGIDTAIHGESAYDYAG